MKKYVFFLVLFCPLPVMAATDYKCPDNMQTRQAVARLPHGWLSSNLTTDIPQADNIAVFDGPPGEGAMQEPHTKDPETAPYWTFREGRSSPIWMRCAYAGQSIHLIRALPDTVTKCTQSAVHTLSCE